MMHLLSSIFIVLQILIFNKLYFFFNKEKIIFIKYLKWFLVYSILLFSLFLFFILNKIDFSVDFLQSLFVVYLLIFLVTFLSISTKSYESPTVLIYRNISNKGTPYNKILHSLKKKKLVKIRIKDLIKQKTIFKQKNFLYLTSIGLKFTNLYSLIRIFFTIKSQG